MPACGSESASVGSFLGQSWVSVYGIIDSDIVKGFYYRITYELLEKDGY